MTLPHVLHNFTQMMKTDIALIAMRNRDIGMRAFNDHFRSIRNYVIETDRILEAEAEVITNCGRYIGHMADRARIGGGGDPTGVELKTLALRSIAGFEQALMVAQPSRTAHALGFDW